MKQCEKESEAIDYCKRKLLLGVMALPYDANIVPRINFYPV